jgi:hypothetical protein
VNSRQWLMERPKKEAATFLPSENPPTSRSRRSEESDLRESRREERDLALLRHRTSREVPDANRQLKHAPAQQATRTGTAFSFEGHRNSRLNVQTVAFRPDLHSGSIASRSGWIQIGGRQSYRPLTLVCKRENTRMSRSHAGTQLCSRPFKTSLLRISSSEIILSSLSARTPCSSSASRKCLDPGITPGLMLFPNRHNHHRQSQRAS